MITTITTRSHCVSFIVLVDSTSVYGVAQKAYGYLDGFDIYRESCSNDLYGLYSLSDMFDNFSTCTRSCMDPVDYVYGVLGLLDLDITRMNDADLVWQTFLSKLNERLNRMIDQVTQGKVSFTINEEKVDLTKATNMADVYKGLLKFQFDEQADLDQAQEAGNLGKYIHTDDEDIISHASCY